MKISVNDQELLILSEMQKNVIKNDINTDIFEEDMKRRIEWVLMHKYEQCFERLAKEWQPRLSQELQSLPTDKEQFASLVFQHPLYKDKKQREMEAQL